MQVFDIVIPRATKRQIITPLHRMPRSVHMPMRPVSASLNHPDLRSGEMAELCALSPLQIRKANLIQVGLQDQCLNKFGRSL